MRLTIEVETVEQADGIAEVLRGQAWVLDGQGRHDDADAYGWAARQIQEQIEEARGCTAP